MWRMSGGGEVKRERESLGDKGRERQNLEEEREGTRGGLCWGGREGERREARSGRVKASCSGGEGAEGGRACGYPAIWSAEV